MCIVSKGSLAVASGFLGRFNYYINVYSAGYFEFDFMLLTMMIDGVLLLIVVADHRNDVERMRLLALAPW